MKNFACCTLVTLFVILATPSWGQAPPFAEAGGPYLVPPNGSVVLNANGFSEELDLKQIGLAIHNHHDTFKSFPAAFSEDGSGTPLLSWRVLLLPFIDPVLYAQFDLTKAWDDPVNLPLLQQMPEIYRGPLDSPASTTTRYAAISVAGATFFGAQALGFNDILDGTSNTAMICEAADAGIPWTKPEDVTSFAGFSSDVAGFVPCVLVDASVWFFPVATPEAVMTEVFGVDNGVPDPFPGQELDFDFEWDLDGNGTFETVGPDPVFSAAGLPAPSTVTVTLRATNSIGQSATDTATIEIFVAVPASRPLSLLVLVGVLLLSFYLLRRR